MPRTSRTTLADKATRAIAVLTVSGLAGLAGWISYRHMVLLARRSGHSGIDAHAFPLTVDGLDLIGVLVLLADRRTGRRSGALPWTVLGIGAAASVVANIAVAPGNAVARAISGWSAIALLAAAKMLAHLFEPAQPSPATAAFRAEVPTARMAARHASTIPRRLPTGEAALARWRQIWHATRHLDAATAETAAAHGVSLRTLQFIRAAGEDGHLDPPSPPPRASTSGPIAPAASPARPGPRSAASGITT
ncbi:MAG: DUF2637 domain-containing protein [Micromonosporaceae bacterium]|nr:DUF2637 domain-containing protein [Micromonosporaceae bacterium]